jgi:ABC-2 type transport system ATP-binding protein
VNVIETSGLGKRYGQAWALRDCTLALPAGCLAALVGPNGAGKSTLMSMAVGLTVPTEGTATVLGGRLAGSSAALDGIAFVAQESPVYRNLSAADMLHLTRNLNRRFDGSYARARLAELGIPPKKKSGKLSGGQRAQLALTLALARRPRLLILDEPLASLDPLAKQDFLAAVMTAMTDDGVSVLLSSHAVAELERVADYLVVLSRSQLRIAGEVEDLLACHRVLTGPLAEADEIARRLPVVQVRRAAAYAHLLVRTGGTAGQVPPGWESHPVSMEELVLAYLRAPGEPVSGVAEPPGPALAQPALAQPTEPNTEPTEANR